MRQVKIIYADKTADQFPTEESYEEIKEQANRTAKERGTTVVQVAYIDRGRYAACGALQ